MHWDLDQLEALAASVTEGSFEAAAKQLHVTPSAISQRIKALETTVGSVLLIRSRPVRATTSGQTLLRVARQIETIIHDATQELGKDGEDELPVVTLAVNADSLATWLPSALAGVQPPVVFDLRREDETRTAELLRNGSVIAAVTASGDPVPGCTVQPLGRMRYQPRASVSFVERWFAEGVTTASLARAPVVVFDRADELQDRYLRRRSRRRLQPPRHYVPGSTAYVEAVRLGLGWGMVPDLQAPDGAGMLNIDPAGAIDVSLYWQQWQLRSVALDRVASEIRAHAHRTLRNPMPKRTRETSG
jgi:LysR family transcriptional regulator, chromosome initiation inhibitor